MNFWEGGPPFSIQILLPSLGKIAKFADFDSKSKNGVGQRGSLPDPVVSKKIARQKKDKTKRNETETNTQAAWGH